MTRCFPPSVFQLGRDHLGWSLESPEGRERMSVDLELLVELHRRIPPIVRMLSGAAATRR